MCNQMGCGSSNESVHTENVSPQPSDYYTERASGVSRANGGVHSDQTVFEAYIKLDEEVCKLEAECPGPKLITIEAWIKYLESKQEVLTNDIIQLPLHMLDDDFDEEQETAKYNRRTRLEKDNESELKVRDLIESLNIMTDTTQAAKHEEFFANISRRYIESCNEALKDDILEHAQKRANDLRELWTKLRMKYNELDALMSSISGNNYTNPNEMNIDTELESSRQIRDKLGGTAEQWRTSANLLRTSAKSALLANEHYTLIQTSSSVKDKITSATDCRTALLGSLMAFKCAQEALPQVDIPHITNRQIVAVAHANEYLLTDIGNSERYQHTKHVLDAYHKSLSKSTIWIHDIFQKTLIKDLQEAENSVKLLSEKLRQIRADYIRAKVGYQTYVPIEDGQTAS
ncbi:uncharacterized protein LOC116340645 [Contarinia nasturtii]|uniref:uncharacterized protein LOC116340645 n=1 Tax=Contarinia nasturtii TaxID=265458 RepID=UPI0012D39ACD|nr:uncharacterized protein LOC116340645 [Contarinia nasturtii]